MSEMHKIPAWLVFNILALMASLAHGLIDTHLGLSGASSQIMTGLQATDILLGCLVIGLWSLSLAMAQSGRRSGLSGAFALAIGWAIMGNGIVFVLAPPPSPAFPYQDIAHFSSLIFGGLAAHTTWQELKKPGVGISWWFIGVAVVLQLAGYVVGSLVYTVNG